MSKVKDAVSGQVTWSILVVDFESWELQKCKSLQNTFQEFLRWNAKDPWGLLKPETIWNVKLLKLSSVKAKLERFWIFVPVVWEMISWRRFLRWNLSLHECPCPQMQKKHNTDSIVIIFTMQNPSLLSLLSLLSWIACTLQHVRLFVYVVSACSWSCYPCFWGSFNCTEIFQYYYRS